MSNRERRKGRDGEREVAKLYERHGFEPRGLESSGDHLVVCDPASGVVIHSEVKRQETVRPWAWWEQASSEAEPGAIPVVHFRRSRSPWLVMLEAETFVRLLELATARLELGDRIADDSLEDDGGVIV